MKEDNVIYFKEPEDYRKPNIHDLDPYNAIFRNNLANLAEKQQKEESIEFSLNRTIPCSNQGKL